MIKEQISFRNCTISPWNSENDSDDVAKTWVWNQLMGETAKGDILDFSIISKVQPNPKAGCSAADNDEVIEENLLAGILKDKDGKLKAIIPAIYEKIMDGIMDSVWFDGKTVHARIGFLDGESEYGTTQVPLDEIALKLLA